MWPKSIILANRTGKLYILDFVIMDVFRVGEVMSLSKIQSGIRIKGNIDEGFVFARSCLC